MAQVIGTVFVLTVAVIQIVGSSGRIPVTKVFSEWKFWFTAGISFLGIISPMIILYFNWLCRGTPLFLGWGAGNLLIIGWFIWRTAPLQARPERLKVLKEEALGALKERLNSIVIENLKEATQISREAIYRSRRYGGELIIAKDACGVIKDITTNKDNCFDEVWKIAVESLIDIDILIRGKGNYVFSETVTIPYLHDIATKSKFKEERGWLKIKEYLFRCFHEDIEKKRIDFEKGYEQNKRTALQSLRIFLSGAKDNKERWGELGEPLIKELVESLKEGHLKEEHLCPIVGLTFNIIVEGAVRQGVFHAGSGRDERINNFYENLISKLSEIADAIGIGLRELLKDKKECAANRRYSIIKYDHTEIEKKFDELMERLEKSS